MLTAIAHAQHAAGSGPAGWIIPALAAAIVSGVYLAAVRKYSRRTLRRWPVARTVAFVAGAAMLGLAASPPVRMLADSDPRGHMVQHLLIGMYAPLALVLAAPVTVLLAALPPKRARALTTVLRCRLVRVLSHPAAAGLATTAGLYALYLTPLHAASADSAILHSGIHLHFLLAGYLFAWSIVGPDPAPRRPGRPTRIAVLIVAAGAHAYLAKLLYAGATELPPDAGYPPELVRQAAQIMYYGGDLAELLIAAVLFAAWSGRPRVGPRPGGAGDADSSGPSRSRRNVVK